MRQHSKQLAQSDGPYLQLSIILPYPMLLEQINLKLPHQGKKQSLFSKRFQLITIQTENDEIALKSAFSECVSRNGKIEYNIASVCQQLTLVFAKDSQTDSQVNLNEVELKVKNQAEYIDMEDRMLAQGNIESLLNDDEDDFRILDSLPVDVAPKSDRLLNQLLTSIEIVGFNITSVPAITNLTYFMNQSFYLTNKGQIQEADKVDFLTSQLLVTTKRSTQAAEMYRKMQQKLLKNNQSDAPSQFIECAVLEMLIADSLPTDQLLNDKIQSIGRLAKFLRGEVPDDINLRFQNQIKVTVTDSFSSLIRNLPDCLRFVIACLSHRMEIVRISALKLLKYILETQGCSLDFGIVFTLKAMLNIYPSQSANQKWTSQGNFDLKTLLNRDVSITEYFFKRKPKDQLPVLQESTWLQIEEPKSGYKRALTSVYQHVLDTVISVLSSVSSHILHSIFYDVIEPTLLANSQYPLEVRVFTCKIAEKIFTICQGDLILKPILLDNILLIYCNQKAQLPDSIEATAQIQIKNLWSSIRSKVFPNYSASGFRSLVNWLVEKLTELKQFDNQDEYVRQLAEVITIISNGRQKNEEDTNQLIRLPSNELFGGGTSSEFYLILAPLLYWLEYSIDREDRLMLFQQIYQTIKDVIAGLAPGQCKIDMVSVMLPSLKRTCEYLRENSPNLSMLKFLDIVLTDFSRIFLKTSKAQVPFEIQYFILDILENFVCHISYSLYEEVLVIFETMIQLCSDVLTEKVIRACVVALVDKYTMKTKNLKTVTSNFMKFLLETNSKHPTISNRIKQHNSPISNEANDDGIYLDSAVDSSLSQRVNYFETMSEFCFFNNLPNATHQSKMKQLEFRSSQDIHDLFLDKLNFFVESLTLMGESHINVFTNLITHPHFKQVLLNLIASNETQVRLKAHEIIENLSQFFVQYCPSKTVYEFASGTNNQNEVMDAEFISHERLYISQIVIAVAKASLERQNDCYLQFNSLILLDFLFQNLLPVPTFQNEQLKSKKQKESVQKELENNEDGQELTLDVEILSISETTPEVSTLVWLMSLQLDVMDPAYLRMRLKLVMSLWPHIQVALNSPWSNIRSICYGLICSMLKIDVADYPKDENDKIPQHLSFDEMDYVPVTQERLSHIVLPMLYSLLSSKESESKAGGLNILGSFCGLSYDFTQVKIHKHIAFFQRNSQFVSLQIWKLVFNLQDDWDITIKEASVVLVQLCAPRNAILYYQSLKINKEKQKLEYLQQMSKVSEVYSNQPITTNNLQPCVVRSEHAKRAIQFFPSQKDRQEVLDFQNLDFSQHEISFDAFMQDRQTFFPQETVSSKDILAMSNTLKQMIHEFNPNYEDKRLTKVQQPMSRRRQLELELSLSSRQKDTAVQDFDPNFFVDRYTDDQIQEIVSIFRNDFKPPKNLWIEKQPNQYGATNTSHYGQSAPGTQSPDFFQEIYSEAIEQFNSYQMMMQQKQQDELQQQVSNGHSLSQSSVSSSESNLGKETPKQQIQTTENLLQSQDSSTPSPQPVIVEQDVKKVESKKSPVPPEILDRKSENEARLELSIGPFGPTSPVLVSSTDKNKNLNQISLKFEKKKPSLQLEQLNLESVQINQKIQQVLTTPLQQQQPKIQAVQSPEFQNTQQKQTTKLSKQTETDYQSLEKEEQVPQQVKTQKQGNGERLNVNFQSNSAPDFNLNLQKSPKHEYKQQRDSVEASSGTGVSGDQMISRKMAQTYFSGLNQGYISNIDNLKLIKTCLNQQQTSQFANSHQHEHLKNGQNNLSLNIGIAPSSKLTIKTNSTQAPLENQPTTNYGSTKSSRMKKSTLSNSPDAQAVERVGLRKSSKFGKKASITNQREKDLKQQNLNNTSQKQMNNLADLNFFIKTIEKDLNKKFKSMKEISQLPNTPGNMIKKVEDQMRVLGVDPKMWMHPNFDQNDGRRNEKQAPPQMKLLALNQIVKTDENNYTPSNLSLGNGRLHKTSSPKQRQSARKSHDRDSDSEFCKTQRLDKKTNILQGLNVADKLRTHRDSDSRERHFELNQIEKLSSGRGASNNSAGNSYCQPLIASQLALNTDRSSQNNANKLFSKDIQKQSSSTRNDSGQQFQFKKGNSKSQQKGYGSLAGKSILSPQIKRDQQSGGIISPQIQMQNQMNSAKNSVLNVNVKKQKVNFNAKMINHNFQDSSMPVTNNIDSGKYLQTQRQNSNRLPQSTRNLEQGDRKQFSPDSSSVGKPPLRKKKSGHSYASSGVQKPSLVLQNPSYF